MNQLDQSAFQYLSIKDLLEAREAFHIHLMKKENVMGTAIGKYRERKPGSTGTKTSRMRLTGKAATITFG